MRLARFYILTFLIAWDKDVVAGGELSEEDLRFIADRLYPIECSNLMIYLPKRQRGNSRARITDDRRWNDDLSTDHSRIQCLETLIECNEIGNKAGCTKKWLEASLRKLGRADLASRLKKRWKGAKQLHGANGAKKNIIASRKSHPRRNERSEKHPGVENERQKLSHRGESPTKSPEGKKGQVDPEFGINLFKDRFVIFVAVGSLLIVGFLGFVLLISYKRASRCYKNLEREWNFEENKGSLDESETQSRWSQKYGQLEEESDRVVTENRFEAHDDSENVPRTLEESTGEKPAEAYKSVVPNEKRPNKMLPPCARIKHFIQSQKRIFRGDKKLRMDGKRKRRMNDEIKRREDWIENKASGQQGTIDWKGGGGKNDRRRTKKSMVRRKDGNRRRKRREKTNRSNDKPELGKTRPVGCICEMCKLFEMGCGEEGLSEGMKHHEKSKYM